MRQFGTVQRFGPRFYDIIFRHYAKLPKKIGPGLASLVLLRSCSPRVLPATRKQHIVFAWIPTSWFMNSFVDTNNYVLVYSFCQYYNLSVVNSQLPVFFSRIYLLVQCIKCRSPLFMFNSGGTLRIIFICCFFNSNVC